MQKQPALLTNSPNPETGFTSSSTSSLTPLHSCPSRHHSPESFIAEEVPCSEPHPTPEMALSFIQQTESTHFFQSNNSYHPCQSWRISGTARPGSCPPEGACLSLGYLQLSPASSAPPSCWLALGRRKRNQHKDVVTRGLGTPLGMFCPSAQTLQGQVNDNMVVQDWGQDPRLLAEGPGHCLSEQSFI